MGVAVPDIAPAWGAEFSTRLLQNDLKQCEENDSRGREGTAIWRRLQRIMSGWEAI